jgi:DnaJ-class molecular chaperone
MARDGLADMYDVLSVQHDADVLSIRRGYREKVRALRLDVADEAEAGDRLRDLTHAYEVLSNPSSRLLYDRFALPGSGAQPERIENGERAPSREIARIGDDEMIAWVLGMPRPNGGRSAAVPQHDQAVRYVATIGFVIGLFFLVALLLHG